MCCFSCKKQTETMQEESSTVHSEVYSYGGSLNEIGKAVVATPDGGFAVLGSAQSLDGDLEGKGDNSFDFWLLRFDAQGNLLWEETYGSSGDDRGTDLVLRPEGGFVLTGSRESTIDGIESSNLWILAVDEMGTLLWDKTFGFAGTDFGTCLVATPDGGYAVTGVLDVTASQGQGNKLRKHAGGDYWVLKLNAEGELIWQNYFGGLQTDTPFAIALASDGGFFVAGSSDSEDSDISENRGSYDAWLVKLSANGQLLWERSYGGSQMDTAYDMAVSENGNIVLVGDTRSSDQQILQNKGGADLWYWRLNAEGELIEQKTFGGSDFDVGRSLHALSNGLWLLSGSSRSLDGDLENNKGQNDAWTFVWDSKNNQIIWRQTVGGSRIDFAYAATALADGRWVTVGESNSPDGDIPMNRGFSDLLLFINTKNH